MRWDVFCRVIDNYGDAGVCWRLCADLAERGESVRLWIDDPAPLAWMAPDGHPRVAVTAWDPSAATSHADTSPGDVVVEAFGCSPHPGFLAAMAAMAESPVWINLEYLTAEPFAERQHALPSPVMHGPARGLTRHFFQPGFNVRTGGLPREPGLSARMAAFDAPAWLHAQGIPVRAGERRVALFCYEPKALPDLLRQLAAGPRPTRLLVTAGRASSAVRNALEGEISNEIRLQSAPNNNSLLFISYLPFLRQADFDHLLWASDLNLVRGEDSLVRALWAGKPLVWQLYPQDDDAHRTKLHAWLERLAAPPSLRAAHEIWNGFRGGPLPPMDDPAWGPAVARLAGECRAGGDLTSRLLAFVREHR